MFPALEGKVQTKNGIEDRAFSTLTPWDPALRTAFRSPLLFVSFLIFTRDNNACIPGSVKWTQLQSSLLKCLPITPLPTGMGVLEREGVGAICSESLPRPAGGASSGPWVPCSIVASAVPLCPRPRLSLSLGREWLEATLPGDQHWRSFSPQLLQDGTCVLKNNQANSQPVQGSQRALTAERGTDSIFVGFSIPVTLRAGQART